MKKILAVLLCIYILISSPLYCNKMYAFAESETTEFEQELEENVNNQLAGLDTSKIDQILSEIVNENTLFESTSFSDKVKSIISGDLSVDASSLLSYAGSLFIDDVLSFLPSICLIIAIAVLYSIISSVGDSKNKGIKDVIHFVCYGAIVVIIIAGISSVISLATSTVSGVKTQMDAVFPVLLTVLTALGGTSSVGIYQPAMAILSGSVISIFTKILIPIFTFKLVFTVISNLTSNIKFNKFAEFFGSCFKWLIGIILTIFSAFISIQGLMAGSIDGISIRTAKYTIKGSIPVIGGFLADGMSLIMVSSSLIKNAVGVGGLILLFSTILVPVIKIIVFSFLMKLATAILEPIADSRVTGFVNEMSKSIALLLALILGVAFMYFIITGLVMCSANVF